MGRLIDAEVLLKRKREEHSYCDIKDSDFEDLVNSIPTAFDTEKVIEQLEEKTDFLKDCTKYGNKDAEQQEKSYSTMMMYEIADLVEDLIDIFKKGGVE